MIQLIVPSPSSMDKKLEAEWGEIVLTMDKWTQYIKSLPGVKDAEWVSSSRSKGNPHTLITFESESDKTWFILRWS
jgi:hypothetical protein